MNRSSISLVDPDDPRVGTGDATADPSSDPDRRVVPMNSSRPRFKTAAHTEVGMPEAKWLRFLAGLFAVSIVLAACSSDEGGGGSTAPTGGTGGATGATSETGSAGGETTITIAGFAFDPGTITVSGPTEVTISNQDSATHTFTLDDGSVDETIAGGETVTVTVDVSETTGWVCNIHPSMTGTVEVA
jgi:plastocyanin